MKRQFWYFILAISGGLIGTSLVQFLINNEGDFTIYLLVIGLILSVIGIWGFTKFAVPETTSNKK